jgi:hypothetical protein
MLGKMMTALVSSCETVSSAHLNNSMDTILQKILLLGSLLPYSYPYKATANGYIFPINVQMRCVMMKMGCGREK